MKKEFSRIYVPGRLRRRMVELSREFRKQPTRSEHILWQALRGRKLDGIKFRRQQPIGPLIVDFYNSDHRLAIEVDGPIHDFRKAADHARQEILETLGLNMLRIRAELIEENLSTALEMIRMKIRELKSQAAKSPSPGLGEGQGERG